MIPLPPVEEQEGIVEAIESYFTRLDDAVATLERVQRNLTRFRASVLKAAVEGRLVPTEAELARAEGRDYEPASVLLERILAGRRRHWGGGRAGEDDGEGEAAEGRQVEGEISGACRARGHRIARVAGRMVLGHTGADLRNDCGTVRTPLRSGQHQGASVYAQQSFTQVSWTSPVQGMCRMRSFWTGSRGSGLARATFSTVERGASSESRAAFRQGSGFVWGNG